MKAGKEFLARNTINGIYRKGNCYLRFPLRVGLLPYCCLSTAHASIAAFATIGSAQGSSVTERGIAVTISLFEVPVGVSSVDVTSVNEDEAVSGICRMPSICTGGSSLSSWSSV